MCTGADVHGADVTRSAPLQMDTLFREIAELAAIFDVQDRGRELVAQLKRRLSVAPAPSMAPTRRSRSGSPVCGRRISRDAARRPGSMRANWGAANVFADAREDWPEVSWEALADRDPDVLVLADLSRRRVDGDALDTKIAFLESNPVTRNLTAVRHKRFVVLTGSELDPGIRQVQAVERLAAGFASIGPAK